MPDTIDLLDRFVRVEDKLSFLSAVLFQATYIELEGKALSGCAWFMSETIEELSSIKKEVGLSASIVQEGRRKIR